MYRNLVKNNDNIRANLSVSYIQGPKVEINSPVSAEYLVQFYNDDTGDLLHSSIIKNNHWTKCLYEYFINWRIKIHQMEEEQWKLVHEETYNAENKRVYIALDSKALGDTVAWFPYINEFKKKHKCKIVCSTFHNYFFESKYPEIEFVNPGQVVNGIYAMHNVGWFYKGSEVNFFKHPKDFKTQPLQKTASDILGLDYVEVIPSIDKPIVQKKKIVSIAIHATAQAKYWNNPNGWQEVVDWCLSKGYEVYLMSKEGDGYMGNYHPKGIKYLDSHDMKSTVKQLCESQAFVGVSSGLSWLSWALQVPTVLVSGFTEAYTEPESCYRVASPEGKCSGCFNKHQLDAGDWNWCPVHKNTDRHFECSKLISSKSVIKELEKALH